MAVIAIIIVGFLLGIGDAVKRDVDIAEYRPAALGCPGQGGAIPRRHKVKQQIKHHYSYGNKEIRTRKS